MSLVTLTVPESDIRRVREACPSPRVALVLGSGLSGVASALENAVRIPYTELEGFPGVGGPADHAGALLCGTLAGHEVVIFIGRVHQYQGASALEAAYPARLAAALGCEVLVVTNAVGGLSEHLDSGSIVLISDHINLMGTNPLEGWPGPAGGNPFVPMHDAYDPGLRALAYLVATDENIALHDGVYAGLSGPSYETPAEAEYLRRIGADVVGMSTVPEVIVARALGLRVLGFSLVANIAASEGLSHDEVLEAGRAAAADLSRLMLAILRGL
ncbi:MAG: purine-nucleoside phosphorylase [Coriobacteriia bacterium]|nr:purine-nucleoside phosphorylase [Coriobacteriia bacterium]